MKNLETKSFLLDVDVKSAIPIYEQIKNALKIAIFTQQLKNDDRITSVRSLSTRHNINPLTILKAYNQLENEGFLYSKRGSGYYVKSGPTRSVSLKNEILKKELADFIKKISGLGFTLEDLQQELKKHSEVTKND